MGYTTEFTGRVAVEPPLNEHEAAYLRRFAETRRMQRTKGPYYTGTGFAGIHDAVADTPSWMLAHAPLAVPEALPPSTDPAQCRYWKSRRWSREAEQERDQTVRLWTLEDRPTVDGPVLWRAEKQTTPAGAWAWYRAITVPAGHRLVLLDTTKGKP